LQFSKSKSLPDFPWDELKPYSKIAQSTKFEFVDLSQGTPVDATPDFIQAAVAKSSNAPGYPLTAGSAQLISALRNFSENILGVKGEFDVLPIIGSKEFIAWLPTVLNTKKVLFPKISYPTYEVGARIAGADAIAVDTDTTSWPSADLVWLNSPANPTGEVIAKSKLIDSIKWARANNSVLASDECYLHFGGEDSILKLANGDNKNIIAVHSLSKSSNMAGYRAAFIVGDVQLISEIRQVRKHAGMMVPTMVQSAMVAALSNFEHVKLQAQKYEARRNLLWQALTKAGFIIEHSKAAIYIWCRHTTDELSKDLAIVNWFANRGILVTPGKFYGSPNYVRIALTATDSQIKSAADRIASDSDKQLKLG